MRLSELKRWVEAQTGRDRKVYFDEYGPYFDEDREMEEDEGAWERQLAAFYGASSPQTEAEHLAVSAKVGRGDD